mmetsp:Transcript_34545/g.45443  ORF Transcript_34545/g.45443 Transcript_34545/m.45443 type:complete len:306 (+) Transcript_34545:14-931(+)
MLHGVRRSTLARVIVLMMLSHVVIAGWFSSGDEDARKPRRRRRDEQEDTVEQNDGGYEGEYDSDQQQDSPRRSRSRWGAGDPKERRRESIQEMNKMRAKNRDEMLSNEYSETILNDELIEETHTEEENLDGYLSDEDINKIWSEHMHDFVPEDMTNVIVERRSTEALMETISHQEPTMVKGAYYVLGGSKEKTVSCIVYDPNRDVVYKRKGSAQGIILFNTSVPGEYAIVFSNMQASGDLTVTLALHTYEEKEEEIAYDIDEYGNRFVKEDGVPEQKSPDEVLGEENLAASHDEIAMVKGKLRDI